MHHCSKFSAFFRYVIFSFLLFPLLAFSQSYTVELSILNPPNENGQIVVIAGTDLEVEFLITDEYDELSKDDLIMLVKLETSEVISEKKRGNNLTGTLSLPTSSNQGKTDIGECVVQYVA